MDTAFNTLNGLPVELILSISEFLPSADVFCLSLCSRRFYAVLDRLASAPVFKGYYGAEEIIPTY